MGGLNILKSNRFSQDMLLGIYEHYRKCSVNERNVKTSEQEEIFKYSVREIKNFYTDVPIDRKDRDFPSILFDLNKIMDKLDMEEMDRFLIIMLVHDNVYLTLLDVYRFLEEHFSEIRSFPETWEIMISLRKMFIRGSIFCPVF